jgi:hypothetical protein
MQFTVGSLQLAVCLPFMVRCWHNRSLFIVNSLKIGNRKLIIALTTGGAA